jgi:hypothetical protein
MRDYTAWFADKDPREDGVNFTDPSTKKPFRAGYAIKDAVFRTNHAYDPTINKWVTSHISEKTSSARSRITDADFAAETANLSRSQVLQQAASAMLAQSNARPQQVLSLLR